MNLTNASVKKLCKAGGRTRVDHRDDVVEGLALRVMPTGTASWVILYSFRGEDRRYTIGRVKHHKDGKGFMLSEARDEARRLNGQLVDGVDIQAAKMAERRAPAPPTGLTVADILNKALPQLTLKPKTRKEWTRLKNKELIPSLGTIVATELTRAQIREWGRVRAFGVPEGEPPSPYMPAGRKPSRYTANRSFEVLRRAYSWAVGEEEILPATPFGKLALPAEEDVSTRVLSTQELRALLVALDMVGGTYADATRLLLLTMARQEMVLGAGRDEVDLEGEEPIWVVPPERSKNDEPHVIPLSKAAVAVIERRLVTIKDKTLLFPRARPRRAGEPSKREAAVWSSRFTRELRAEMGISWAKAEGRALPMKKVKRDGKMVDELDRLAAGRLIPRWTIHNLRQAIATHMRESLKIDADVISKLLSHTPPGPKVTRVYLRAVLLPERRSALVAWAAYLERLRDPQMGRVLSFAAGAGVGTGSEMSGGTRPNRDESR